MAKLRRCHTCKVVFPTIDAVNEHYRKTSHKPLPYKCGFLACELVYANLGPLLHHIRSKHQHSQFCEICTRIFDTPTDLQSHKETNHHIQAIESETRASSVVAKLDASNVNSRRDDDDGWGSLKEVRDRDVQRDPTLAENHPSTLLSGNISKPLSSVSELTSSSASSSAAAGPSSSKLDKATALARAALRNRFAELGVLKSGETTPLLISNLFGPRKADSSDSSLSNLDGSCSVATNLSSNTSNLNEKEEKESKIPLNSLDNIIRPSTCPGCRMDFKSFSEFVLHIENRSCTSSMCHEIEDQLDACVTQFFNTLASSGMA